jgi:anion-transporting  ArsA/GET3 family ATPase
MALASSDQARRRGLPKEKRIYVTVGAGGVGKTTVSAALGLGLAQAGRTTAVLTVDPARRLLQALNLGGATGGELVEVEGCAGRLWAGALHVESALERLVEELAPDGRAAKAVKENRVYRQLIAGEGGVEEIAAVAQLYALARDSRFEAIVLDTPPAANALEFLDAPRRLREFLESRAIGLLLAAAGLESAKRQPSLRSRAVGATTTLLLRVFARATGSQLVGDLASFLEIVARARGQLIERAAAVEQLLREPQTGFLVVCVPDPVGTREAAAVADRLQRLGLPLLGVVVNRVHGQPAAKERGAELSRRLGKAVAASLANRLAANLEYLRALASGEQRAIEELEATLAGTPLILLPELEEDGGGLGALQELGGVLLR